MSFLNLRFQNFFHFIYTTSSFLLSSFAFYKLLVTGAEHAEDPTYVAASADYMDATQNVWDA